MGNVISMDEYRPYAPEGTIEFAPDETGVEQIDLHKSDKPSIERLRALAVSAAETQPTDDHPVDAASRGDFGGNVLDFTARLERKVEQAEARSVADYLTLHGARIVTYRAHALEAQIPIVVMPEEHAI